MSVIEDGRPTSDPTLVRLAAYVLAAVGVTLGIAYLFRPGAVVASALLAVAPATLAIALLAPEAFEVRWRLSRMLNPVLGLPAALVCFWGLPHQLVDPVWPVAAGAAGGAIGLASAWTVRGRPGLSSPISMMVLLAAFGGLYGYGATIMSDVQFDASSPSILEVPVIGKDVTHDRSSTSYELRLPAWGGRTGPNTVTVSQRTYEALSPGDSVCIFEHPGALSLPWFVARPCPEPGGAG